MTLPLTEIDFAGTTLTFGQINIIHGANGTGKTTLLNAIAQATLGQDDMIEAEVPLPRTGYGDGHDRLALLRRTVERVHAGCVLTFDTPETGLGDKLQREVALLLVQAAHDGGQVFVATHSLFLMRELELLSWEDRAKGLSLRWRYFGLHRYRQEPEVDVSSGDDMTEAGEIESVRCSLQQMDRQIRLDIQQADDISGTGGVEDVQMCLEQADKYMNAHIRQNAVIRKPVVKQADDMDDTGDIESLEERLVQGDKYLKMDY